MLKGQARKMFRQCMSKRKYDGLKSARKGIVAMRNKYGKEARAYICEYCGGYHLTTKNAHMMNEKEGE